MQTRPWLRPRKHEMQFRELILAIFSSLHTTTLNFNPTTLDTEHSTRNNFHSPASKYTPRWTTVTSDRGAQVPNFNQTSHVTSIAYKYSRTTSRVGVSSCFRASTCTGRPVRISLATPRVGDRRKHLQHTRKQWNTGTAVTPLPRQHTTGLAPTSRHNRKGLWPNSWPSPTARWPNSRHDTASRWQASSRQFALSWPSWFCHGGQRLLWDQPRALG